jgi:predicted transcriptional regulator
MTVVSSREFASNQSKYYNLAVNDDIFIKRGKNTFRLMHTSEDNTPVKKRVYYEPDEDFYRSISAEEFRKELAVSMAEIDKMYAGKCK